MGYRICITRNDCSKRITHQSSQNGLFQDQVDLCGWLPTVQQLLCNSYYLYYIHLSVYRTILQIMGNCLFYIIVYPSNLVRYIFTQLSELWQYGVNEIALAPETQHENSNFHSLGRPRRLNIG